MKALLSSSLAQLQPLTHLLSLRELCTTTVWLFVDVVLLETKDNTSVLINTEVQKGTPTPSHHVLLKSAIPKLWITSHQWVLTWFWVGHEMDKLIAHKENVLSPTESETEVQQMFTNE